MRQKKPSMPQTGQVLIGRLPYRPYRHSQEPIKSRPYLVLSVNYRTRTMQIVEIVSTDQEHSYKRNLPNIKAFGCPPGLRPIPPLHRGSGIACNTRQTLTFDRWQTLRSPGKFSSQLTSRLAYAVTQYERKAGEIRDALMTRRAREHQDLSENTIDEIAIWREMRNQGFSI